MDLPITPGELARQMAQCLEGRAYKVFLALNPGGLGLSSTVAQWEAAELAAANGYAPFTGTFGVGAWNAGTLQYELPAVNASFTASGAGFTYDTVVIAVGADAYPYSVVAIDSTAQAAGQTLTYPITLAQKSAA